MKLKPVSRRFFFFFIVLLSYSCSEKDDNPTNIAEQEKDLITSRVTTGTWRITKFIDSGDDEISHFTGYNFTFGLNGVLTATKSLTTYTGSWSISRDNSDDDDNSSGDLDFNIMFNLTNELEELNDDWDIISHSATKLELIDISGGNSGTDNLTFEKN